MVALSRGCPLGVGLPEVRPLYEDTTGYELPLSLRRKISLPSTEKESEMGLDSVRPRREPWNKGKLVGQKAR